MVHHSNLSFVPFLFLLVVALYPFVNLHVAANFADTWLYSYGGLRFPVDGMELERSGAVGDLPSGYWWLRQAQPSKAAAATAAQMEKQQQSAGAIGDEDVEGNGADGSGAGGGAVDVFRPSRHMFKRQTRDAGPSPASINFQSQLAQWAPILADFELLQKLTDAVEEKQKKNEQRQMQKQAAAAMLLNRDCLFSPVNCMQQQQQQQLPAARMFILKKKNGSGNIKY